MFLILRTGSGVGFEAGDHDNRLALESCDEIAVGPHQWRHHQRKGLITSGKLLSGDRGAFQNGSARTRSDADAAHMRKASGIMQMRQTRQMQIDEDACIRN